MAILLRFMFADYVKRCDEEGLHHGIAGIHRGVVSLHCPIAGLHRDVAGLH